MLANMKKNGVTGRQAAQRTPHASCINSTTVVVIGAVAALAGFAAAVCAAAQHLRLAAGAVLAAGTTTAAAPAATTDALAGYGCADCHLGHTVCSSALKTELLRRSSRSSTQLPAIERVVQHASIAPQAVLGQPPDLGGAHHTAHNLVGIDGAAHLTHARWSQQHNSANAKLLGLARAPPLRCNAPAVSGVPSPCLCP